MEPDKLAFVLDHLRKLTLRVGYFCIHMGAAKKNYPDGRNTHLIQRSRKWWKKMLGRFFKVEQTVVKGPELYVVLSPKAKEASADAVA